MVTPSLQTTGAPLFLDQDRLGLRPEGQAHRLRQALVPRSTFSRAAALNRSVFAPMPYAALALYHSTLICLALGFSLCCGFGTCTVSTPSLLSQRIASALTPSGNEKLREKLP